MTHPEKRRGRERVKPKADLIAAFELRPGVIGLKVVETVDEGKQFIITAHLSLFDAPTRERAAAWLSIVLPTIRRRQGESLHDAAYRSLFA